MMARMQITMETALRRRAQRRADDLGLSFAEYVRRVVASDLGEPMPAPDVSIVFDLVADGPTTDIARDKDKMIAEAIWREYRRGAAGQARRGARLPAGRAQPRNR